MRGIAAVTLLLLIAVCYANQERGVPWAALILTVLLVAFSFLANRTALGRHANAVGGNAEAAPRRHRGPARARSRV